MITLTKPTTDVSAIYDRIYDIADRLFKKYNPCNIHTTKTGFVLCKEYKTIADVKWAQKRGYFLCCSNCKHQSKIGCTIKCLPCKLFHCCYITDKLLKKRLRKLRDIAAKNGIVTHAYYHTKEEILIISERQRRGNFDQIL